MTRARMNGSWLRFMAHVRFRGDADKASRPDNASHRDIPQGSDAIMTGMRGVWLKEQRHGSF